MGFSEDAIAVVSAGLRRSTGSFAERLVSSGYVGDVAGVSSVISTYGGPFSWLHRFRGFIS